MDSFKLKLKKGKEAIKSGLKKGHKPNDDEKPAPATLSPSKDPPSHDLQLSSQSPSKSAKELSITPTARPLGSFAAPLPPDSPTIATSIEAGVVAICQPLTDGPSPTANQSLSRRHDSDPILMSSETLESHDKPNPATRDTSQGPLPHVPRYAQFGLSAASSPTPSQRSVLDLNSSAPITATTPPALLPTPEGASHQSPVPENSPALNNAQPSPESSRLWQDAYERLRFKEEQLVLNYEIILKNASNISSTTDVRLEVAQVVTSQKEKMENSQWTFQWNGKPQKIRDTISRILKITSKASALISVGMTYAPPYVSIPWAAIGALIPLMAGGFDSEDEGLSGLEKVAQIISSYRIVEDTFLKSSQAANEYSEAVIGLYVEVLKYQATAAQFFGKHTLTRFGSSVVGSTDWTSALARIEDHNNRSRGSILHLGIRAQGEGFEMLMKRFENSEQLIKSFLKEFFVQKGDVEQLLTDLATINYIQDHRDIRKELGSPYFSSGQWFLKDKTVVRWRDWKSDVRVLWLVGSVGVGKSSLTSMLLEDLAKDPSGRLAFFYCSKKASKKDQKPTARDNFENVLRTLLIQLSLADDGSTVSDDLQGFHRRSMQGIKGGGLELEDCLSLLRQILTTDTKGGITIVIDALDECLNYTKLLTTLKELLHGKDKVRMFITSRFDVDVPSHFGPVETIVIEQQNWPDILTYVQNELKVRRQGSGMTDKQALELESILMKRHEGMFMWVKLVIDYILDEVEEERLQMEDDVQIRISELKDSVSVPKDSEEDTDQDPEKDPDAQLKLAYDKVYARAIGRGKQPTRRHVVDVALKWILCAFRPLTLTELAYATSVQADGSLKLQQGATILAFCSNFLVEGSAGTVRFAHVSVKQYLERRIPPEYTALEAHTQAAMTCLLFLKSPKSHEIGSNTLEITYDASSSQNKDFSTYIQSYWSRHCREARQTAKIRELEESISKEKSARSESSKALRSPDQHNNESSWPKEVTDDSTAGGSNEEETRIGIQRRNTTLSDIENLIAQFRAPDLLPSIQSRTPTTLHDAVRLDEENAVELLIAADTDLASTDEFGNTALHEAVRYNRLRIVERLADVEAPLDAKNKNGDTALHFAAFWGFEHVLKALISGGARRDERNNREETPLHIAVLQSHYDIIRILLLAGVDVNAKDVCLNPPLHYAAAVANDSIIDLIISHGGILDLQNTGMQHYLNAFEPKQRLIFEMQSKIDRRKRPVTRLTRDLIPSPSFLFPGLCDYCNLARWLVVSPYITNHRHLQSYIDLKSSADGGCKLCALFLREFDGLGAQSMADRGELTQVSITLSLAQQSASATTSSDILTATMGGILSVDLELCIDQALRVSPLHEYISGRTVCKSSADRLSFEWIYKMRRSCHQSHRGCSLNMSPLPTRVIDVGPPDGSKEPVLLETRGRKGYYAYLSWQWGAEIPEERLTTQESLQERVQSFPFDKLGQTHLEAIIITRRLGLRYLWIDALCVIQKGPEGREDWLREAQLVGLYLTNASFTMVAPGVGFDYGMFTKRASTEALLKLDCRRDSPAFKSPAGTLSIRRPTKNALEAMSDNVLQRGWILQELVLPQRNLIFSAEQIYWNCQTISSSEGTIVTQMPLLRLKRKDGDDNSALLSRWYHLLETYSATKHFHSGDRFPALMHMAEYVKKLLNSRYYAGLFESDLLRGLLWRAKSMKLTYEPFSEYIAPSWSWVSFNGPVSYSLAAGVDEQNANTSVLGVSIIPPSSFPHIISGELKLRALSRQISTNAIPKDCDFYFDTKQDEDDWRSGHIFFHVLVSLWQTDLSDMYARWVGIIVVCVTSRKGVEEFRRVGLAIGPEQETTARNTEGWKRRDFTII